MPPLWSKTQFFPLQCVSLHGIKADWLSQPHVHPRWRSDRLTHIPPVGDIQTPNSTGKCMCTHLYLHSINSIIILPSPQNTFTTFRRLPPPRGRCTSAIINSARPKVTHSGSLYYNINCSMTAPACQAGRQRRGASGACRRRWRFPTLRPHLEMEVSYPLSPPLWKYSLCCFIGVFVCLFVFYSWLMHKKFYCTRI